jgi:peptidoglycan/xylan/chitin deacetylase (PgdA/CDA1 family)
VAGILEWFREQYREVLADCLPRYAPISTDELRTLAASEHADIGSHGHEHRILSRMSREELLASLQESRDTLEALTGLSIDDIAYPNGDYESNVIAIAESCGYRRGYTVRGAIVDGAVPAMQLPRLSVGAFDSPALLRWKICKLLARMQRRKSDELQLSRST